MTLSAVCASTTRFLPSHSTGKERDAESGNDYFGARYYASSMGRFLSPDPKMMTARHLANPQKWNKYAYVINNPLTRFDPDGMDDYVVFRTVTAGANSAQWGAAEKSITSQRDSQGRLNTFHMVEGDKATLQAFNKALTTKDTHAVFVGHADENPATKQTQGITLAGLNVSQGNQGGTINTVPSSSAPGTVDFVMVGTPALTVTASSVALFGCDTAALSGQYDTTSFTGVSSGSNGTELQTLDLAAAGWVGAGGGQAGDNAAQSVINASTFPTDKNDKVVTTPPKNQ